MWGVGEVGVFKHRKKRGKKRLYKVANFKAVVLFFKEVSPLLTKKLSLFIKIQ
jgi:hypothetical protein